MPRDLLEDQFRLFKNCSGDSFGIVLICGDCNQGHLPECHIHCLGVLKGLDLYFDGILYALPDQ